MEKLTPIEAVLRAKTALTQPIRYLLGRGGFDPSLKTPAPQGLCDCSGYVAWCLGIPRQNPELGWIETTRVFRDAETTHRLFEKTEEPALGDVLVYRDQGKRQGHIGLITAVNAEGKPWHVIHCASSHRPWAVRLTEVEDWWWKRGAIVARALFLRRDPS